ncbi:3-oxoacyl-(acyl-carrier-protein) synthase [Paenibacillus silagei]|uniref:3-oxoacyl-(Acyl-carrier-protein) synthase n=1 Tax=Paenibacillus silagei TaxID=1670801 RepID=A0ABS4P1L8_9BACL|nr:beta-ketoacyl-[acyl-carrier-protein] synthase family protein [Paenibacillus silagei]MBP2115600.1 3-oxoacyl-(acyl-carrier-protein) synthase [Paenibacillus silagei]
MENVTRKRVVITGMGLLTPLGNTLEQFWRNSLQGKVGYDRLQVYEHMALKSRVTGTIPLFEHLGRTADEAQRAGMGRPGILAVNAAIRAVADAGLVFTKELRERSGVCIANAIADTPFSEQTFLRMTEGGQGPIDHGLCQEDLYRKGMFSYIAFEVAHEFGLQGEALVMSTGCTGGIDAVGYGYESIIAGEHDVMICGAAEAPVSSMTISSFDAIGALTSRFNDDPQRASRPFEKNRSGFVLSEGCAVVVLEELEHALRRQAPIYGEVTGFASTNNAFHMTDLPQDGDALSLTMNEALGNAGLTAEDIQYINAHGSSTPQNDAFETAAYKRTFGELAYSIPISSTKSMVGHPLSAASAIEIVHCLLALNEGYIPPTANLDEPDPACDLNYVPKQAIQRDLYHILTNASGFSGIHSAMILAANEYSNRAGKLQTEQWMCSL